MTITLPTHPCFGHCDIDSAVGRCTGCGHKFAEVLMWGQLSPERRDEAEGEAKEFLAARGHPGVGHQQGRDA